MKNFSKALLIVIAIGFYPFGCEAQTGGIPTPDSCDTVFIEDPQRDLMEQELRDLLDLAKSDIIGLEKTVEERDLIISTQANQISSQGTQIENLLSQVSEIQETNGDLIINLDSAKSEIVVLKKEIQTLEDDLAQKPDTVYKEGEIVYRDRDSITVGGIEYKVAEIEQILPFQTVDTIQATWCDPDPTTRKYWHEGDINVYPHFVNFATKERGMIKVYFKQPLDTLIKKHNTLTLQRIRSHKEGITQYDYISSE